MQQQQRRGVHLHYGLGADDLGASALDHPMFDVLVAIDERGSIRLAAQALGLSYRHVWGHLKTWEQELGVPLVAWVQGTPAHLTPFAERLVAAERRARARIAPHLDAMRLELQHVLAHALDTRPAVLRVACPASVPRPAFADDLCTLAATRHELHLVFDGADPPAAQAWWHPADAPPATNEALVTLASHHESPRGGGLALARTWCWSAPASASESPAWLRLQDLLQSSAWSRLAG
jgi:molybdate transport repressor ModE-like protein